MPDADKVIPAQLLESFRTWHKSARLLQAAQIAFLLTAAVSSIVAASALVEAERRSWFALAAAISVAVMSSVDLGGKANGFRNAWRLLNAAQVRFQRDPTYQLSDLVDAYERAERIIGDLPVTVTTAIRPPSSPEVKAAETTIPPAAR